MMQYLDEGVPNEEAAMAEVVNTVYDNSLPLFRRMIEAGLVRITFIDHAKVSNIHCMFFEEHILRLTNHRKTFHMTPSTT
jgi:hypothetical protein